jgi:hypothetical protein
LHGDLEWSGNAGVRRGGKGNLAKRTWTLDI